MRRIAVASCPEMRFAPSTAILLFSADMMPRLYAASPAQIIAQSQRIAETALRRSDYSAAPDSSQQSGRIRLLELSTRHVFPPRRLRPSRCQNRADPLARCAVVKPAVESSASRWRSMNFCSADSCALMLSSRPNRRFRRMRRDFLCARPTLAACMLIFAAAHVPPLATNLSAEVTRHAVRAAASALTVIYASASSIFSPPMNSAALWW